MRVFPAAVFCGLIGLTLAGCSIPAQSPSTTDRAAVPGLPAQVVVQAGYFAARREPGKELPSAKRIATEPPTSGTTKKDVVGLPELIGLTLERNPRLAQVSWAVEAARGRAAQAGLCPNPTVNVTGNELGDRTGPSGIWSVSTSQEIVTAHKLGLSRAAALREADQATLRTVAERYGVLTEVRQAYFDAVVLQRRAEILTQLVKLAEESVASVEKLLKAKEAARLDVVQLEVDLERYRAEREATERALPAAYQRLAASVGIQDLTACRLCGDLDTPLPEYDLDRVRLYVLGIHPDIRSAQLGVERAELLARRAEVEPIPNVTVGAGYTRQGQNRSNDWDIGVSVPVPLWNRNQGNILAAKAQVGEATSQVERVRNDLVNRLATAFGTYSAARKRAERYKTSILPKAQETYQLSLRAYKGGQFEYLRVLASQRTVAEANLELGRSLGEMWRAASEVAGLMLEDHWPFTPATPTPERKEP